jgi:hypothetical protein
MSKRCKVAMLSFDPAHASLRDGLSVAVQIGNSLWLANDETTSVERLNIQTAAAGQVVQCNEHRSFSLLDLLNLPLKDPEAEIDIEGVAFAPESGYLWLTGSHSLKRKKPEVDRTAEKNIKRLSTVTADGNRFTLARIPLVRQPDGDVLARKVDADARTAALLRGDETGNDLTTEIAADDQLRDFLRIPGKDNGFDIEGLVVIGSRLLLGLRGPVLRGWAVLLEIEPELSAGSTDTLVLKKIGPNGRRYRKHFLALNGLGIRDLCMQGDDLLILAGPTMDLDGPVTVFRWRGGFTADGESVIFADQLESVLDIPFGQGDDHAEGMCLFQSGEATEPSLLVVYDSAAQGRKHGETDVEGDLFCLGQ